MVLKRNMKQIGIIILFIVLSIVFQHYMGKYLYGLAYMLYPLYKYVDPDNVFMHLFIHHILQGIIFMLFIWIAGRLLGLKIREFGFNLNDYKTSMKYIIIFCIIWAFIQFSVSYLLIRNGTAYDMGFEVNLRNTTGYLLFQILLSGTSEELFYRGFVITVLMILLKPYYKKELGLYVIVILLSTINFMIGHIGYQLFPPQITYINGLQQLTVIISAVVQGITFLKTKSLLGPILMHNLLNGIITLSSILYYYIFK